MKNIIIKYLSLFIIIFSALNFTYELSINAKEYEEKNKSIEDVKIDHLDNCIEIDINYPKLTDKKNENINKEISLWTDNWIKETQDVLDDYKKSGYICNNRFELNSRYYITKDSNNLLSFYIDYYQFSGGAHGSTTRKAYVIDKKLNKKLSIKELFKIGYDYKTVIDKEIRNQINKNKEKYFVDATTYKGINDDAKFYIKGENLVIYYNQYEIAPYASGIPEFNIPINDFKENFLYNN